MKTKNILKCLFVVIAVFTYSCSGSDDGDGGTAPGTGGGSGITSITVTASNNSIELGGSVTFTVTANDGSNVTTSSTILINNSSIQGVSFTPTATGMYLVRATNGSLSSPNINIEVTPPVIVALRVESAVTSIKVGDTADFIVIGTDAAGNDYTITADATISVNGTPIAGNRFMATAMGDLNATATLDAITSTAFTLPVTQETAPGAFAKNVVIEDMTGAWCGYCPRVSYGIELVKAQTTRAYVVAAHVGDNMGNSDATALDDRYNTVGYPFAIINRDVVWNSPEPNNVAQVTSLALGTTSSGLSINSIVDGGQLKIYVSAAFAQALPGAKLVVMVLEDGIVLSQANYTSYYGGIDPIPDFVHNHTLRDAITNVFGDVIPAANTMANTKYTQVFDIAIPPSVQNNDNMSVIAMIVSSDDKVRNVSGAHVGTDKDFHSN